MDTQLAHAAVHTNIGVCVYVREHTGTHTHAHTHTRVRAAEERVRCPNSYMDDQQTGSRVVGDRDFKGGCSLGEPLGHPIEPAQICLNCCQLCRSSGERQTGSVHGLGFGQPMRRRQLCPTPEAILVLLRSHILRKIDRQLSGQQQLH